MRRVTQFCRLLPHYYGSPCKEFFELSIYSACKLLHKLELVIAYYSTDFFVVYRESRNISEFIKRQTRPRFLVAFEGESGRETETKLSLVPVRTNTGEITWSSDATKTSPTSEGTTFVSTILNIVP